MMKKTTKKEDEEKKNNPSMSSPRSPPPLHHHSTIHMSLGLASNAGSAPADTSLRYVQTQNRPRSTRRRA